MGAVPHLSEVANELADDSVVFLMVTDEAPSYIEEFLKKKAMPGWVVIDKDKSTLDTFKVTSRPRTIVLDTSGTWLLDIKPEQLTAKLLRSVLNGDVRSTEIYGDLDPTAKPLGPESLPPDRFGRFELIAGTDYPIRTGFHGLAAPAAFDYDGDGKQDLIIGEFETGPSMLRAYRNVGTAQAPEFTGESKYLKTVSGKNIFIDSW